MKHRLLLAVAFLSLSSVKCLCAGVASPVRMHQGYPVLQKAFMYTKPISRSQWLWNADAPVRNGAESFFRVAVMIPGPIEEAFIRIHYDDSGSFYVNGVESAPEDIKKRLRTGENMLCFRLKNGFGPSGLLFYGEIHLTSGERLFLHSHSSAVRSSATSSPGWVEPGFDDSSWKPARNQGDTSSSPWANYANYTQTFTSPQEKATLQQLNDACLRLPEELGREPDSTARIVYEGHVPLLEINGVRELPLHHIYGIDRKLGNCNVFEDNIVLRLNELGVKNFEIRIVSAEFYQASGSYDFRKCDEEARRLLNLVPEAHLILSLSSGSMKRWCQEHPQECVGYGTGPAELTNLRANPEHELYGRPLRPSAASEIFHHEFLRSIDGLIAFAKRQPWGKRVIGFRLSYGTYSEWHGYGMYQAPDCGPCMTARFRDYLSRRYGSDCALQAAWGDSIVTLATAAVPGQAFRHGSGGFLLDPVKHRRTLDYFECHSRVHADLLVKVCAEVKRLWPGKLCGAYYGYVFTGVSPEGANLLLDRVLSSPHVDFLSNPMDYTAWSRRAGGDGGHRTIPATFHRYGKLPILEDDSRFHQTFVPRRPYSTRTPRESRVVACRNICNMMFDGAGLQFYDVEGGIGRRPHFFDDPDVLAGVRQGLEFLRRVRNTVPETSGNDTAVVISYLEMLRHDNRGNRTALGEALYKKTKQHLYRSGVAFDLLSLQDFLASDQPYKVVVFLNLFSPSQEERQQLESRQRRLKANNLWLVAPGCLTEGGFSDLAMSRLAGIALKGASCNPEVYCADPDIKVAVPGTVYREQPDGTKSLFCATVPDSPRQWREILRAAGSHVYVEGDCYLRRQGQLLLLHTGQSGRYVLSLPDPSGSVREFIHQATYRAGSIDLTSDGPELWIFQKVK